MQREIFQMDVEAIGSEDGRNTYEIRRRWGDKGKKSLVIELYPTLRTSQCGRMDVSTMHLLNHAGEFGWSEMRIVNLYSSVFAGKPTAGQLGEDAGNLSYIEAVLEEEGIKEYDLVVAWGTTLQSHKNTIHAKIDLLSMIKEKGLAKQVRCIVTDSLDSLGVHPLYLGLRHASETWKLKKYPLEKVLSELEGRGAETEKGRDKDSRMEKETSTRKAKKGAEKDVPENHE